MSHRPRPVACHLIVLPVALCVGLVLGCDDRTAEEKGADYAGEKLGFVEGAAGVLEERGRGIGSSVGTGVGELVKGAGSAVKDVVNPAVKAESAPDLVARGLAVLQAHEGDADTDVRKVALVVKAAQPFEGRLRLRALDAGGLDMGQAPLAETVVLAADEQKNLDFGFAADTRLSKASQFVLEAMATKLAAPTDALAGVKVSQLKEDGSQVSLYVVFEKAYRGGLELRAFDAADTELGRSLPGEALKQDADSARHVVFSFDALVPLARASRYSVHPAKAKAGK